MLYRSGENLFEGAKSFVDQNDEITLFSAYLKLNTLKKLNKSRHIKQIIVRWEIKDLCLGVSDFEKFPVIFQLKFSLLIRKALIPKSMPFVRIKPKFSVIVVNPECEGIRFPTTSKSFVSLM